MLIYFPSREAYSSPLGDRLEFPPILIKEASANRKLNDYDFLLAHHIVLRFSVSGEVNSPGSDVDVHQPVDNPGLKISLMSVDYQLLSSVDYLHE